LDKFSTPSTGFDTFFDDDDDDSGGDDVISVDSPTPQRVRGLA
jgi:hypothetical protein